MSSIWKYRDSWQGEGLPPAAKPWAMDLCPFCPGETKLVQLVDDRDAGRDPWSTHSTSHEVRVCTLCGWWVVKHKYHQESNRYAKGSVEVMSTWGVLRRLGTTDLSESTDGLRRELLRDYGRRLQLTPKECEDLVAGVYADFGYTVRVTGRSGDRGIDIVVFDPPSGEMQAVQVKRYRNRVEASPIREFAGALLLGGYTKGIVVTTSDYTTGARKTAADYRALGVNIQLVNALEFYEHCEIAQRTAYTHKFEQDAPWQAANLLRVEGHTWIE